MSRVTFTFKNGRTRDMSRSDAEFLRVARQGTYLTRDMQAGPAGSQPSDAAEPAPADPQSPPTAPVPVAGPPAPAPAPDAIKKAQPDLDAMDTDALRALAQERGVKVHHNAGADKIREALRQAKA